MTLRQYALAPLAAALAFGIPAGNAAASTCQDELNRFQSRLYGSSLANDEPQLFRELVREARKAATLRDETQCLERVGALYDALPGEDRDNLARRPEAGSQAKARSQSKSRPKAPTLLIADGPEEDDERRQSSDKED